MTVHKDDAATDVDAIQVWSAKELEGEFTPMLKAYHDKETEFNWEAREKAIIRLRGLLRGNATEPPYLEVLVPCMKQMVDGIVKGVESLRTQLAVKALLLIEDIGIYMNRHVDNYTTDQILLCMMRCSTLSKKIVAMASFKATNIFLKHISFYPKVMNMLSLSMNEKNIQARLYAIGYTKIILQTHAHRDHTRAIMDRVVDHFENVLTKGLNDPTPTVKEACREAFWIFWEYWREKGDDILRQLPAIAQKQLEKSKNAIKQGPMPTNSKGLPGTLPRASTSMGRHHDATLSPSTSSTSNGSSSTHSMDQHHPMKRSMSPRSSSPHLRSSYGTPPSSLSSHLQQYPPIPSSSTSPTPPSHLRKTRVPTLNRKKSSMGLITKRKPSFMTQLNSEDATMRAEGLVQLAKKLELFPYTPRIDLGMIQLDVPNAAPVQGDALKMIVLNNWEDNYQVLSSWSSVTGIMLKLLTFEEYIPKLILDAHADDSARRTETDLAKYQYSQQSLVRAKLFLQCENPDLVDALFTSLVHYGGFVTAKTSSFNTSKKDITKLPANRRKLTKEFLEWMDELVTPLIGLNEDIDYSQKAYEGVPDEYTIHYVEKSMNTTSWFESDDNVRQCLAILLPLITTSTSGTMWHAPLVTFMKHIRLLNQRLFEMVTATYDDYSINKICRVLGIHIRVEPPATIVAPISTPREEPQDEFMQEEEEEEEVIQEVEDTVVEDILDDPVEDLSGNQPILDEEPIFQVEPSQPPQEEEPAAAGLVTAEEPKEELLLIQPLAKMTLQERNVDHEILTPPVVSTTGRTDDLTQKALPPIKHEASDYFSSNNHILQEEKINQDYLNHRSLHPSDPNHTLYDNASNTPRTATEPAPEPTQQPQQPASLPVSIPNPEKYPVPVHVPFFAPEKVNFPNPVFEHNARTMISTNGSTTTNRNLKDKTVLLYSLIDKLMQPSGDHHTTFRKLIRLIKEVPIRRRWDQGGMEENGSETWAGAKLDAGNFVELVQSILYFLDHIQDDRYLSVALECVRQLAVTQAGLLRFFERKVDTQGRTLESQLMAKLLDIRSNENPTVCIAAEDALDTVLGTLNPPTAFEMLMAFIIHRLFISPSIDQSAEMRYHPVGSAFMYLSKWVREMNDTFYIDEWLAKGGVNAFFNGMNHSMIIIRKSCVDAIVAFHEVIGDHLYLFLADLREDQLNLLRHYVAKSLKKNASLRNLRDNNNNGAQF